MKILVADDEPQIVKAMQWIFEKQGYDVVVAARGDVALSLVESEQPDVVFLDLNMPGMSGLEICDRLRTHERCLNLPIYILTGQDRDMMRLEPTELGATAYLVKPISRGRLLELVSAPPGTQRRSQ